MFTVDVKQQYNNNTTELWLLRNIWTLRSLQKNGKASVQTLNWQASQRKSVLSICATNFIEHLKNLTVKITMVIVKKKKKKSVVLTCSNISKRCRWRGQWHLHYLFRSICPSAKNLYDILQLRKFHSYDEWHKASSQKKRRSRRKGVRYYRCFCFMEQTVLLE